MRALVRYCGASESGLEVIGGGVEIDRSAFTPYLAVGTGQGSLWKEGIRKY